MAPGVQNIQGMSASKYIPRLPHGVRVRFIGREEHPKNGQDCTIIRVLPNPSQRVQSQWYDVRFDDYSMARFLERYLIRVPSAGEKNAA